MATVPSQDQVMGQLRIIIPALGTIVSAIGVSSGDVSKWVNIAMISVGPISYIVVAIWSLIANSRASIMAAAAKPVEPGAPAPQIVLPPQEAALADKLPSNVTASVIKALLIAFALSMFLPHDASAQPRLKTPAQIQTDIDSAFKGANQKVTAAVTGQPVVNSTAALPCMDITMLPKLTPFNLIPTMKSCVQDVNNQLVTDTERALDSAKAFAGSATGSGTSTVIGDNDAINCLTPALALFKAAAIVPAVPVQDAVPAVAAVPAVLNPDGSVKTPAIPAVAAVAAVPGSPELDPGPILLGQKFREFTLAGGLTSCQNWVNEPINAVAAAGIAGVGAVAGAAVLAPK